MNRQHSKTIILARGQTVTGRHTTLRGYPYQIDLGAAVLNCDLAVARAAHRELGKLLGGEHYERDESAPQPLPPGVDGFDPHAPTSPPTAAPQPDRPSSLWPSYRTDEVTP